MNDERNEDMNPDERDVTEQEELQGSGKKARIRHWHSNETRLSILRRTAKEIRVFRVHRKLGSVALICLSLMVAFIYMVSALYKNNGSFSVAVDKVDLTQYGLSLSETRDMLYATSHLNAKINERITNISRNDLPENLDMIDGEHNGDNYIAYTFYLQNSGEEALSYEYEFTISNVTKGLDEAVHIRMYVNGVMTEFAKTRSDGQGPEDGTTEFYSIGVVTRGRVDDFQPGQITKYTVVAWLEGDDPDCVDRVIDGLAKLDMNFSVIH